MDLNLKGKKALVTGSTAGIGCAVAKTLYKEGADIVLVGRSEENLKRLSEANFSKSLGSGQVFLVVADVTKITGCHALFQAIPEIDILVNNLGIYEARDSFDITDEEWLYLFEVNVMSGVRLSRFYMPKMLEKNWGRVIFISSESGVMTPGEMIHYGFTKTAQLAISKGLSHRTRGTNVTVNAVLPGPTRSPGVETFIRSLISDSTLSQKQMEEEFFLKHRPGSLLGRLIEPEEVANLVAYIASTLSSATNGAALRVEGGLLPTVY